MGRATRLLSLLAVLVAGPTAAAQSLGFDDLLEPAITSRELARGIEILDLDESQRAIATEMLASYQQRFEHAAATLREVFDAAGEEARRERDPTVWQDLRPVIERFRRAKDALGDEMLADLRLLLTEEQTAQWPRFERDLRRERLLDRWSLVSGEAIDLIDLVESLEPADAERAALDPILERYARELDAALVRRDRRYDEATNEALDLVAEGAFERLQEVLAGVAEEGVRLRDLHRRFLGLAVAALEPARGAELRDAFRQRSHPRIYRRSIVDRAAAAIRRLDDVTPEQIAAVDAVLAAYERRAERLNGDWARAVEEAEAERRVEDLLRGGLRSAAEREARAARRALDGSTLDELRGLLTTRQASRLPRGVERRPLELGDEPGTGAARR